jgi:hypothetical protein
MLFFGLPIINHCSILAQKSSDSIVNRSLLMYGAEGSLSKITWLMNTPWLAVSVISIKIVTLFVSLCSILY